MITVLSAVIVAAAILWAGVRVTSELRASGERQARLRALDLIALFAPGIGAAAADPRALLTWQPLAVAARQITPDAFAILDRASGTRFPFSADRIRAAHSQWTAEWLAWERSHDGDSKLKAAAAEAELARSGGDPLARARLDAIEREKLERYQQRYEEYVRVAKALHALAEAP